MIKYKFNIYEKLKSVNISYSVIRETGLISQRTLTDLKKGKVSMTLPCLSVICALLDMQPGDILEYVPDAENLELRERVQAVIDRKVAENRGKLRKKEKTKEK